MLQEPSLLLSFGSGVLAYSLHAEVFMVTI
jgi:hypothetical protein